MVIPRQLIGGSVRCGTDGRAPPCEKCVLAAHEVGPALGTPKEPTPLLESGVTVEQVKCGTVTGAGAPGTVVTGA